MFWLPTMIQNTRRQNIDTSSILLIEQNGLNLNNLLYLLTISIGERVYIPRVSLTPSDTRIPFKFQRRQFPILVCFAMTINKRQGQSLKQVGIYLPLPVFSHGELYVAVLRVTSRNELKFFLTNENGDCINTTTNVVYKEIFQNM